MIVRFIRASECLDDQADVVGTQAYSSSAKRAATINKNSARSLLIVIKSSFIPVRVVHGGHISIDGGMDSKTIPADESSSLD